MFALLRFALALALTSAILAHAQAQPSAKELADIEQLFDSPNKNDALHCSVIHFDPFFDFTFRYDAGFVVNVPISQFGSGEPLTVYLRATPEGGKRTIFRETFDIPPVPPEMAKRLGPKKLKKIEARLSAGFAMGDGRYAIDLLVMDGQQRDCRKHWNLKTPRRNPQAVPFALPPNTVVPMDAAAWDGKLDSKGVRLTVLLHVAPINPFASKLYAWDRGFLLQSLASLLKQLPCQSVRVIAFNLDQQQEVFREEHFDHASFARLASTLRKLEFATVSYQALQRGSWPHWLVGLVREQISSAGPSDAVVFLGPTSRFTDKVPGDPHSDQEVPHFFYFEYYPYMSYEFPDSIDFLTRGMHGTVYKIHSADQLGQAILKMLEKMKQTQANATGPAESREGSGSVIDPQF